jgi:peptidase M50B-like protein
MQAGEDYPGQHMTAYHEAGHAIAAIKTGGRIKEMNLEDRTANDENGYTVASYPAPDEAFYIYAGPWTHAKFNKPSKPVEPADVIQQFLQNSDDWIAFKKATGITRPDPAWHEKAAKVLAKAWDNGEIQGLAERLIAHTPEIDLDNGQRLVRENARDRWHGTDYHDVPDDGDGLVGPPPPIPQRV